MADVRLISPVLKNTQKAANPWRRCLRSVSHYPLALSPFPFAYSPFLISVPLTIHFLPGSWLSLGSRL